MNTETMREIAEEVKKRNPKLGASLLIMNHLREEGNCPMCKKPGPFTFKDELSKKEFGISGMCQECQDEIFKDPEE